MRFTLKQIVKSLPAKKNSKSSVWVRLFIRKLSFPFTYIFINLGFSANAVSMLSIAAVILGSILLSVNNMACIILGVSLINFWLVLDCVDGNIARCKKQSSYMGEFFDALGGYAVCAFAFLGVGIAAYNRSVLFGGKYNYLFIIIGAIGSITNITARLTYQKYTCNYFMAEQQQGRAQSAGRENDSFDRKPKKISLSYIRLRLDKQIGISGAFMPLLILAAIFNFFDVITVLYSLYHTVSFFAVLYIFAKKAADYEAGAKKQETVPKYKIGYTTGVYDLFHIGHLNILQNAKEKCEYLIVGVSTDELVMNEKNKTPIIPYEERIKIIKAVACVDKAVPQENKNKLEAYQKYHFDSMFVGSDWEGTPSWEQYKKELTPFGVQIVYLEHTDGISSTILREKLNEYE